MSSALTFIVLGTVNIFGPGSVHNTSGSDLYSIPRTIKRESEPRVIPDGYISMGFIGIYKVHNETKNWHEARRICQEENAHLAIIDSVAEAHVVSLLLKQSDSYSAHIGYHILFKEEEYATVHGESLAKAGFEGWRAGETNNSRNDKDCGRLWSNARLGDAPCEYHTAFVCELPHSQV